MGRGGGGLSPVLQDPNFTLSYCSCSQHLVRCSVLVVNPGGGGGAGAFIYYLIVQNFDLYTIIYHIII